MAKDAWDKFMDSLLEAIQQGLDNGTKSRLRVQGGNDITIDIYPTGQNMDAFEKAIKEAAKKLGATGEQNVQ